MFCYYTTGDKIAWALEPFWGSKEDIRENKP